MIQNDTLRLVARYARLKGFYSELDTRSKAVHERYSWWPCKAGCAECCNHSLFLVSEIEAKYFLPEVGRLGKYKKREIQQKSRSIISHVRQKEGYLPWPRIVEKIGSTKVYPCPLLENNQCLAYEKRPAICRVYGYHLLNMEGQCYWCDKVEQAVTEHREHEKIQAMSFRWAAEQMQKVLVGDVKPIAAWLDE